MVVNLAAGLGRCLAGLLVGLVLHSRVAAADVYSFTYLLSDGTTLGGVLTGSLRADLNTFDVAGYTRITFNGATVSYVPNAFEAYSEFYAGHTAVGTSGVVTLDGSYMNFIDEQLTTHTGYDFIVNVPGINFFSGRDVGVFGFSSLHDRPFVAANLHASVSGVVPGPGSGTGSGAGTGSVDATMVPEPGVTLLLAFGVTAVIASRRLPIGLGLFPERRKL